MHPANDVNFGSRQLTRWIDHLEGVSVTFFPKVAVARMAENSHLCALSAPTVVGYAMFSVV
jgi:hypothetical protein